MNYKLWLTKQKIEFPNTKNTDAWFTKNNKRERDREGRERMAVGWAIAVAKEKNQAHNFIYLILLAWRPLLPID